MKEMYFFSIDDVNDAGVVLTIHLKRSLCLCYDLTVFYHRTLPLLDY